MLPSASIKLPVALTASMRNNWIKPMLWIFILTTLSFGATAFAFPPLGASGFVGPVEVDLNQYNLPFDRITEEWTVKLIPDSGPSTSPVYLSTKSDKEVFIDTFTVNLPRSQSLGIELMEIAGGRQDDLGITVVTGLVEGGAAENSDITAGDIISKVTLSRRVVAPREDDNKLLSDVEEKMERVTECLGYDATVTAIQSFPPMQDSKEMITLTVKRIRRVPTINVTVQYPPRQKEPDTTIELFSGENLRKSLFSKGIKLTDDLAREFKSGEGPGNCGDRGICTDCAVSVIRGGELLSPPRPREQQMVEDDPRWRLSCRTFVGYGMREGEVIVRVNPKAW